MCREGGGGGERSVSPGCKSGVLRDQAAPGQSQRWKGQSLPGFYMQILAVSSGRGGWAVSG